jgi:hypothetical protein
MTVIHGVRRATGGDVSAREVIALLHAEGIEPKERASGNRLRRRRR